jgi:hypothetical protein
VKASGIHSLELILILLWAFVVGFGALARRLRTPDPIILVIAGLLESLLPGMPKISLSPDVVFLGFLPPLLFGAAFTTSWRGFRYNLVSICFLAFGLVGFTLASLSRRERNSGEISPQQDQIYRNLAQTLRKIEYATALELRDKNQINDDVLRTLQRDLDFMEAQAGSS